MGASKDLLTSKEFADRSGLPVSKVTKLLRDGSIKGQKIAGKWMIPASELKAANQPTPVPPKTQPRKAKAAAAKESAPAVRPGGTYSVAKLADMTYLTEFGVRDWLKKGLLKGTRSEDGEWYVDAASLENPNIKRLLR
ncbi:MAG: helix-turn-helix domain-containing protein [Desulfobacterales bacterium]|nr:helix-turn-helix domain-containing protein [Desulfobacterales bacterium]